MTAPWLPRCPAASASQRHRWTSKMLSLPPRTRGPARPRGLAASRRPRSLPRCVVKDNWPQATARDTAQHLSSSGTSRFNADEMSLKAYESREPTARLADPRRLCHVGHACGIVRRGLEAFEARQALLRVDRQVGSTIDVTATHPEAAAGPPLFSVSLASRPSRVSRMSRR